MIDLISRQAVKEWVARWEGYIDPDIIARMQYRVIDIPSAQPTLYGYPVEHLTTIAMVLQKENLSPEKVADVLTDIGRIVNIVRDEFEGALRKVVEQCQI